MCTTRMVMDDNVEIVGFFNDLSLLLRDAEHRNPGTDLLILKEKSILTLHFIREDRNVNLPNLDFRFACGTPCSDENKSVGWP